MAMCNKSVRWVCALKWANKMDARLRGHDTNRVRLIFRGEGQLRRLFWFAVAEALERSFVVPPFGFYFDPQLQEHFAIDECL